MTINTILWSNKARKQLLRIPKKDAVKIHEHVDQLATFPESNNVKKLSGHHYDYRLRVGRYRILFDYSETVRVIAIEEVKKRDERTY